MPILLNIIPIYLVIAAGALGVRWKWLPRGFIEPANQVAFRLAVPALLLRTTANAPFHEVFQPIPALAVGLTLVLVWLLAAALSRCFYAREDGGQRGSWIQSAFHSNVVFVGLPVVYYGIGPEAVGGLGMVVAVFAIVQNGLAVLAMARWGRQTAKHSSLLRQLALNPIILATLLGLGLCAARVTLPVFLDRTLQILSAMGPPLALLTVGASLGPLPGFKQWPRMLGTQMLKLVLMPAIGLVLLAAMGITGAALAPAVIVLASPTATLLVILASQMGGT